MTTKEIAKALKGCENWVFKSESLHFFNDTYIVFRVRPKNYDCFLMSKKHGLIDKCEKRIRNGKNFK